MVECSASWNKLINTTVIHYLTHVDSAQAPACRPPTGIRQQYPLLLTLPVGQTRWSSSIDFIGRVVKVRDCIDEFRLQESDDVLRFLQAFAELGIGQESAQRMERLGPRGKRGPGDLAGKLRVTVVRAD